MAGSFVVDGDSVTITFKYSTNLSKAQSIIGDSAHYLWDQGYGLRDEDGKLISWEYLTNQQKIDIVDGYVKKTIADTANTFKSLDAQRIAKETEEENSYEL